MCLTRLIEKLTNRIDDLCCPPAILRERSSQPAGAVGVNRIADALGRTMRDYQGLYFIVLGSKTIKGDQTYGIPET